MKNKGRVLEARPMSFPWKCAYQNFLILKKEVIQKIIEDVNPLVTANEQEGSAFQMHLDQTTKSLNYSAYFDKVKL